MSDMVLFVGFHPLQYWGLATAGVVIVFIATLWVRNARLRSAIRAIAVALLLAPVPFGIHKSVIWIPLWMVIGINPLIMLLWVVIYGSPVYFLLRQMDKWLRMLTGKKSEGLNGGHT